MTEQSFSIQANSDRAVIKVTAAHAGSSAVESMSHSSRHEMAVATLCPTFCSCQSTTIEMIPFQKHRSSKRDAVPTDRQSYDIHTFSIINKLTYRARQYDNRSGSC